MFVRPDFYDEFICKASDCTDTCCAGWEIDVDADTLEMYRNVKSDFSDKLTAGIDVNLAGQSVFRLKKNGRCFFLCNNGLCEIYSNLGKDALCDICREHPRFYNFYPDTTEVGLGLCCEKVCELLFRGKYNFSLLVDGETSDSDYKEMSEIRDNCFKLIYDGNDFILSIRSLSDYVSSMNDYYSECSYNQKEILNKYRLFSEIADLFSETEPINAEWTEYVKAIKSNINKIVIISDEYIFDDNEYKNLLSYTLYRHFVESAYNYTMLHGLSFSLASLIFIHICDCYAVIKSGKFKYSDRIDNVKLWSKQIEYSEENTCIVYEKAISLLFD